MKHNPKQHEISIASSLGQSVAQGNPQGMVEVAGARLSALASHLGDGRAWYLAQQLHRLHREVAEMVTAGSDLQDEFQKYFKDALDKFGVSSPADLESDSKRSEFFNWISDHWKKGEGPKETAHVEVADSYVKIGQDGRTYRLLAKESGALTDAMIWKDGAWVKPGDGEAFDEKKDHRMWGKLKNPNDSELAAVSAESLKQAFLNLFDQTRGRDSTQMAETFREIYGQDTRDLDKFGLQVPNITRDPVPGPLGEETRDVLGDEDRMVAPATTVADVLNEWEPENDVRLNGMPAKLVSIGDDFGIFRMAGDDEDIVVPLDSMLPAETAGSFTVLSTSLESDRILATASVDGEPSITFPELRELAEAVTMATGYDIQPLGRVAKELTKAGATHQLGLLHAGLQRIYEGHALITVADLNNLCGRDSVDEEDVVNSVNITHLQPGEYQEQADVNNITGKPDYKDRSKVLDGGPRVHHLKAGEVRQHIKHDLDEADQILASLDDIDSDHPNPFVETAKKKGPPPPHTKHVPFGGKKGLHKKGNPAGFGSKKKAAQSTQHEDDHNHIPGKPGKPHKKGPPQHQPDSQNHVPHKKGGKPGKKAAPSVHEEDDDHPVPSKKGKPGKK